MFIICGSELIIELYIWFEEFWDCDWGIFVLIFIFCECCPLFWVTLIPIKPCGILEIIESNGGTDWGLLCIFPCIFVSNEELNEDNRGIFNIFDKFVVAVLLFVADVDVDGGWYAWNCWGLFSVVIY